MKKLILIALMCPMLVFGQSKIRNTQITSGNQTEGKVLMSDGETNVIWGEKTDSVKATLPIVSTKTSTKVYDISINPATPSTPGSLSAADKAKLDSLGFANKVVTETNENAATTSIMVSDGSTDRKIKESAAKVTATGSVNIPTGQTYQINGTQISSANLSNDANLTKYDAVTKTFTGTGNTTFVGNVGFGTTDPKTALHIRSSLVAYQGAATSIIVESANSYPGMTFSDNGNSVWLLRAQTISNNDFIIYRNSGTGTSFVWQQAIGISRSSGNFGVGYFTGTEITNNKLAVNGSGYFNGYVDATSYKIAGISTFLDWVRTGYAPASGYIVVGQGTSASPIGVAKNTINLSSFNNDITSGTNTGNQTITNTSDATSHTATLSASGGSLKLAEGSGITLTTSGTSGDGIVTIASSGGGLSEVPNVFTANTSFTLDRDIYINAAVSTNANINITLSNLGDGESGNIEVTYTGSAVVTFIVNASYTIDMPNNIYSTTTNAYTKSVLSVTSGRPTYSYYRTGNYVKIHGTQNYN